MATVQLSAATIGQSATDITLAFEATQPFLAEGIIGASVAIVLAGKGDANKLRHIFSAGVVVVAVGARVVAVGVDACVFVRGAVAGVVRTASRYM